MAWLDSILNWLSKDLPWKSIAATFAVATALLLFSKYWGIDKELQPFRVWLVVAVLFSGFWLLARIGESISSRLHAAVIRHRGRRYLHNLNSEEKRYCKWFIDNQGNPLAHNPANGAISSLVLNGILWKPDQGWGDLFEFNIQPWALAYLKKTQISFCSASEDAGLTVEARKQWNWEPHKLGDGQNRC